MNRYEAEKLYIIKHPCIYKGAIFCKDCPNMGIDDDCDMKEGRILKMGMFCDGYLTALTGSERPEGPGWHILTAKVYVSEANKQRHDWDVKEAPNGCTRFYADEITGTWRKVEP